MLDEIKCFDGDIFEEHDRDEQCSKQTLQNCDVVDFCLV